MAHSKFEAQRALILSACHHISSKHQFLCNIMITTAASSIAPIEEAAVEAEQILAARPIAN